jgi:hypothetical protein
MGERLKMVRGAPEKPAHSRRPDREQQWGEVGVACAWLGMIV